MLRLWCADRALLQKAESCNIAAGFHYKLIVAIIIADWNKFRSILCKSMFFLLIWSFSSIKIVTRKRKPVQRIIVYLGWFKGLFLYRYSTSGWKFSSKFFSAPENSRNKPIKKENTRRLRLSATLNLEIRFYRCVEIATKKAFLVGEGYKKIFNLFLW